MGRSKLQPTSLHKWFTNTSLLGNLKTLEQCLYFCVSEYSMKSRSKCSSSKTMYSATSHLQTLQLCIFFALALNSPRPLLVILFYRAIPQLFSALAPKTPSLKYQCPYPQKHPEATSTFRQLEILSPSAQRTYQI